MCARLPACMHAFVMHSVVCMFVLGVAGVVAVVIAVVEDVGNSRVHEYILLSCRTRRNLLLPAREGGWT